MMISPFAYAAELEQAASVTAVLDAYPREQQRIAVDDLYARHGRPGLDLCHEYENDLYEIEQGAPAAFVLLH